MPGPKNLIRPVRESRAERTRDGRHRAARARPARDSPPSGRNHRGRSRTNAGFPRLRWKPRRKHQPWAAGALANGGMSKYTQCLAWQHANRVKWGRLIFVSDRTSLRP